MRNEIVEKRINRIRERRENVKNRVERKYHKISIELDKKEVEKIIIHVR